MKTLRIFFILFVALFMLGNRGCVTTDTIIAPEGPQAAALSKKKDDQIAEQVSQIKAQTEARAADQASASKAASSVKGMIKVTEYLPEGPPSAAIKAEGDLALGRLPPDDPAETVKSLERVVLILTGQRDEAQKRYQEASTQIKLEREAKEAKDLEISNRDAQIKARDGDIIKLSTAAEKEKTTHAADMKKALDKKDAQFADYKKAQADKERRWLVNATRMAALGLIVAGAIALAVFKMLGVGGGLIGAGVLVGLISVGVETLTAQVWWPWLCGAVFVGVIAGAIYGIYRLWVKHELDNKKTAAIQDMIDEATVKGDLKAVEELKAHLTYRMGDRKSFWGKQQAAEAVKLGLVDPKGEAALKTPTS